MAVLEMYRAAARFWQDNQLPLAQIEEAEGTLKIAQTNGAALRDLRVSLLRLLQWALMALFVEFIFPHFDRRFGAPPFSLGQILFVSLGPLWLVVRSVNRMFGKRTCVLDKSRDLLVYNGFTVGPLQEIRAVKAQVKNGLGRNPMFRLVLELRRGLILILIESYYVQAPGDVMLSRNGFGDPNTRFAIFQEWLDCDRQNLVPFVLPEVAELQQQMTRFLDK